MSFTFGFYNSLNGDRKYNATQMAKIFDGIINDGILMSVGSNFVVTASSGMNINVGTGRAWFNHTWSLNDTILVLTVDAAEIVLNRMDTVVLEIDARSSSRANSIKIIKGTPASSPVPATLSNADELYQYPLAYIYVASGVTEIITANITNKVGTVDTPFATGVMATVTIDDFIAQWGAEWTDWTDARVTEFTLWMAEQQDDFTTWFTWIQSVFGEDPVGEILAALLLKVDKTSDTGAAKMPYGTTAERPVSPLAGYMRFNTDLGAVETYNGSTWITASGQMYGNAQTKAIAYNSNSIAENITILTGTNAMSVGPIMIEDGFTVTIEDGAVWTII